jgi:hypothetical protein
MFKKDMKKELSFNLNSIELIENKEEKSVIGIIESIDDNNKSKSDKS